MKKFFMKLAVFILLVVVSQFLLVLKYPGIPDRARVMRERLRGNGDLVYFGSSAVYWSYPKDAANKSISEYLHDILPQYTVSNAAINSGKMDLYLAAIQYMLRKSYYPKLVIIPINLRSFSPVWDRHSGFQYDREKFYFRHGNIFLDMIYRPLSIDKKIKPSITPQDYFDSRVYNGDQDIGSVGYFRSERFATYSDDKLREKIAARYMMRITKDHHLIQDMREIIRTLRANNIGVLFYITPIDHQTGEEYLGNAFVERLRENIQTIQAILLEAGEPALDISCALDKKEFTWRPDPDFNFMNEHLTESGKLHVARLLVPAIEQKLAIPSHGN